MNWIGPRTYSCFDLSLSISSWRGMHWMALSTHVVEIFGWVPFSITSTMRYVCIRLFLCRFRRVFHVVLPLRFVAQSSLFSPPRPRQALGSAPSHPFHVACAHHVPQDVAHAPPAPVRLQNHRLRTTTRRRRRTCRLFCRPSSSAAPSSDVLDTFDDSTGFDWGSKGGFEPHLVLSHPGSTVGGTIVGPPHQGGRDQTTQKQGRNHACMHGWNES